jgi:hypothetical protein
VHHKEECQGRLRKLGEAHLQKAERFNEERNWTQSLRFSELALTMLKKLTARPFEVIEILDDAMRIKYNALNFMGQKKEGLECAKVRYSLWAAGYMRHHGMYRAAFPLIEGLIRNEEFEQAVLIAGTAHEMIINDIDNVIPDNRRQEFIANGSRLLALATFRLAESGGIPTEKKQKAGEEAIVLARKALEIRTPLHGAESDEVAVAMGTLASILTYFNGVDDDEIPRLQERAITIYSRVQGSSSPNVAASKRNLGITFEQRADQARNANDLDRYVANLELALPHYREAERIYRIINHMDAASRAAQDVCDIEETLRAGAMEIARAATTRG